MQPQDDMAYFAKYLEEIYTSHRLLVQLSTFPRLPLLKQSNDSAPSSVTGSEHPLPNGRSKKGESTLCSAFHPRASCCSPAASATSPEQAPQRAPDPGQFIHQRESLNHWAEIFSCTFKSSVTRPQIFNFLGLLALQTSQSTLKKSFISLPKKNFQAPNWFFGSQVLAQAKKNLIYGNPEDQEKLVQFIDIF